MKYRTCSKGHRRITCKMPSEKDVGRILHDAIDQRVNGVMTLFQEVSDYDLSQMDKSVAFVSNAFG